VAAGGIDQFLLVRKYHYSATNVLIRVDIESWWQLDRIVAKRWYAHGLSKEV
jgi:hypothetical protein